MEQLTRKAYAKINLGLDVLRRREDGYHEVKMIMQTVGIHDVLTFDKRADDKIVLTVDKSEIPAGDDNLIVKAAKLLLQTKGITQGVNISLQKNIPVAAGMAGGSTDAAATFWGLNELFDLECDMETLQKLGVKLGADIPYCIQGGTALSEGIGEKLSVLPAPPDAFLVVAKPDLMISTKYVYENLHANELKEHPDIDGMVTAIKNQDIDGICSRLGNVLETVTERENPIISILKKMMVDSGAKGSLMSGSGPTVFGIFEKKEDAKACADRILDEKLTTQVYVTKFE